jgi:mRNA (guanine-N7-)-methyltransferase
MHFGNTHFRIEFPHKKAFPFFGGQYLFTLEDAVEKCPEFLLDMRVLVQLFKPHGLCLVEDLTAPFREFHMKHSSRPLPFMSRDQWEVARNPVPLPASLILTLPLH